MEKTQSRNEFFLLFSTLVTFSGKHVILTTAYTVNVLTPDQMNRKQIKDTMG